MKKFLIALACFGLFLLNAVPAGSIANPSPETADPRAAVPIEDPAHQGTGVVAYYFHVNARCQTCLLIEQRSEEVIKGVFGKELQEGALAWRVVNTQQPENRRFTAELRLPSRGLVLVAYQNGNLGRWKNLDGVWQHVHGDPDGFHQYVSREVRDFLALKP